MSPLSFPCLLLLPSLPSSLCRLVKAWPTCLRSIPCPLTRPFSFHLLTIKHVTRCLKQACAVVLGLNHHVTLHSLRCGAGNSAGLPLHTIMPAGIWKSKAFHAYLQCLEIKDALVAHSIVSTDPILHATCLLFPESALFQLLSVQFKF